MTSLLVSLVLWLLGQGAPSRITERNRLKAEAERAFARRDPAKAARLYEQLGQTALIPEAGVLFNQAHAYFALGDTARARQQYARLLRSNDPALAAASLSQLGVLACRAGDSTLAMGYFRRALELNHTYETARYNYELVYKTRPRPRPNAPAASSAQTSQPTPRQANTPPPPVAPSETRQDVLRRLNRYDLTEEKARMLLDAMRANEIQYIQQRHHSPKGETTTMKQTW